MTLIRILKVQFNTVKLVTVSFNICTMTNMYIILDNGNGSVAPCLWPMMFKFKLNCRRTLYNGIEFIAIKVLQGS